VTAFLLAALAGVLMVRAHRQATRLDAAALERARRTLATALIVQSLLAFALARPCRSRSRPRSCCWAP
jgi:hypothetical protein